MNHFSFDSLKYVNVVFKQLHVVDIIYQAILPPVHSQLLYMKFRLFQVAQGIGISFLFFVRSKKSL